jgi:hypothetical protein
MKLKLFFILSIAFWSLWFGGMIAMILFVINLFGESRDLGTHAAPVLFRVFSIYQILLGMVACASGSILTLLTRRKSLAAANLIMVLALAVAMVIRWWTVQMLQMIATKETSGPEFAAFHHKTSAAYSLAAALLLIGGIVLIISVWSPSRRRVEETVPA